MKPRTLLALAFVIAAVPAGAASHSSTVPIHLIALNDFHGHIEADRTITVNGKRMPAGGAAWITSLIRARKAAKPGTLFVEAGDMVGASPPVSSLFRDEPTVKFLDLAGCDVGTLGNHEFDRGVPELLRLWRRAKPGSAAKLLAANGNSAVYPGASFPIVCANIVIQKSGATLFPPYLVKKVGGARIGFIGAVTSELPSITSRDALNGIREIDPVPAINRWARYLGSHGVHAIVVLLHEGGTQTPPTPEGTLSGAIVDIARQLDPDVDVVVSAHSHQYTNAFVGRTLITQARSYGTAIADIDLTVDMASGDIVRKRARIEDTTHDGVQPAKDVAAMVAAYESAAAPRINRVIGEVGADMSSEHGAETMLGDMIADAQRESVHADVAFMNPGGVRAGLPKGQVTWGQVFTAQPFNNQVTVLKMTAGQIKAVLEQQWGPGERETILFPSGITYTYDAGRPIGDRVQNVNIAAHPAGDQTYKVAVNSFLAGGGDGFTAFAPVKERTIGPNDLDALTAYLRAHPGVVPRTGRIGAAPMTGNR
jgi:5'-nucleotidase